MLRDMLCIYTIRIDKLQLPDIVIQIKFAECANKEGKKEKIKGTSVFLFFSSSSYWYFF